jgi:hypothetical protein
MGKKTASANSALDRYCEAHFYIHAMIDHYHTADAFRWSLNSYLRALKEVPQLIQMSLQKCDGFKTWFGDLAAVYLSDPLVRYLSKQRDIVVHREMLVPQSSGAIGVTEGRGMKLGFGLPFDPLEDSDFAIMGYLLASEGRDILGILKEDEDSLPCVERIWRMAAFDDEIITLASHALDKAGELLSHVYQWLEQENPVKPLNCHIAGQMAQIKTYDRGTLRQWVREQSG